jgi:hypothetical protein
MTDRELITTLLGALRLCKAAVEDSNLSPSARLELVRDYSTPAIIAADREALAEWRRFWLVQAPEMDPQALDEAAQAMANAEHKIPAHALARLRAKVGGVKWTDQSNRQLLQRKEAKPNA